MDRAERLRKCKSVSEVATLLLPGTSKAIRALRSSALALSGDLLARGALLVGPPGVGKSTLARTIGLCRYLHLLKPLALARVLKSVRLDEWGRLTTDTMDWYREISLTGLVDSLADTQLFGIARKVASEVEARDGVFRLAMNGLPSAEDPTLGARTTGGVVFLDEIGDLPDQLQPKLLTVLSGGTVYPVGREGVLEQGYIFRGLTITATWRDLGAMRSDLLDRVSDHVIRVPTLNERAEDLPELVEMIMEGLLETLSAEAKRLQGPSFDDIDASRVLRAPPLPIASSDIDALSEVDWTQLGDFRGLTQVLKTVLAQGLTIREALQKHRKAVMRGAPHVAVSSILGHLLSGSAGATSLSQLVREAEQRMRCDLDDHLRSNEADVQRLAKILGLSREAILQQLRDLRRDRRRG